ncbi:MULTISPECIES: NUDIX domain-containing protein [unclassified Microbacterium]|uniref:NUDIX domain-containing protein n=1 Tax=unclassified Microbacterium TaxID=2609290 RepID=UPI0034310691
MPAIRNIAVGLPVKDGHVLALEGYDGSRDLHFLRAIGGGIEFGETAVEALNREYMEELGVVLDSAEPLGVFENIFTYKGEPGHEIAHVFAVTSTALDAVPLDAVLEILDQGSPVRWVPITDIASGTRVLFPAGAPESLLALVSR